MGACRRHQIRRHLAKLKHPIVGDVEYGKGHFNRPLRERGLHRPFLHAGRLRFAYPLPIDGTIQPESGEVDGHPTISENGGRGKEVVIVAPLAQELEKFMLNCGSNSGVGNAQWWANYNK